MKTFFFNWPIVYWWWSRQFITGITLPSPDHLNPHERVQYDHLVRKLMSSIKCWQRFDICVVDDLVGLCRLRYTPKTQEYYRWLSNLHCVEFKYIPQQLRVCIPWRLSNIFTEGTLEADQVIG